MATPVFCCGAECRRFGSAGEHWIISAGTPTFETGAGGFRSGLAALRFAPVAGQSYVASLSIAALGTRHVGRFYVGFVTLPDADTIICTPNITNAPNVRFKVSDSKLYAAVSSTFGATGVPVTTGVFYRIDYDFNISAGAADFCDVRVDGVACGQATATGALGGSTQVILGFALTNLTGDMIIDDFVVSATAADYPIGPGSIESFVPNADGTHTFTTTIGVRGTLAAPTGGGNIAGSTDSYLRLNARPILGGVSDNTFLWNQQTNASTLYGEVQFEDAQGIAPRAVEVLVALRDAATATGDRTAKLNDNGTEDTIYASGAIAGITTDYFRRKHYATAPSTGAAWTLSLFNGVRFRFGYSADANPDHYCRGVMIEAEFPEVVRFVPPSMDLPPPAALGAMGYH